MYREDFVSVVSFDSSPSLNGRDDVLPRGGGGTLSGNLELPELLILLK